MTVNAINNKPGISQNPGLLFVISVCTCHNCDSYYRMDRDVCRNRGGIVRHGDLVWLRNCLMN